MFRFAQPAELPGARVLALVLGAFALALVGAGDTAAEPVRSRVIVTLRAEAPPIDAPLAIRFAEVQAAEGAVLADVDRDDVHVTYRYDAVPGFVASATGDGIQQLRADPRVARVAADVVGQGFDNESYALTHVNEAQDLGYTGEGVVMAIIDSGSNWSDPDFFPKVVHEECFMDAPPLLSRCPDGSGRQTGTGAAQDDHGHGTNVSGIMMGQGLQAPIGVAPGATLQAYKVIDSSNVFYFSDLLAAVDHILAEHLDVDVINLSLGAFETEPPDSCVSDPFYDAIHDAGIIAFVSSGNQRAKTGMAFPACVDKMISVGAVYDTTLPTATIFGCTDAPTQADQVACWSNSDATLDLLAPGCPITSAGIDIPSTFCGTSQAAPHAAGAAALLLEKNPGFTPDEIESILKSTGVPVTDAANNVTTPRIDVLAALTAGDRFGDVNCDLAVNGGDAGDVLGYIGQLGEVSATGSACPPVGSESGGHIVGDNDCDGFVTTADALRLLLFGASLPVAPGEVGCPNFGDSS